MTNAMGLLGGAFDFSAANAEEFNEWYDSEHIPRLEALPGVLMARRFNAAGPSIAGSGDRKYVATYHLTSPDEALHAPGREELQ